MAEVSENGCYDAVDFKSAANICASFGPQARLCTKAELVGDCTKGPDCGHDEDLVWSSEDKERASELGKPLVSWPPARRSEVWPATSCRMVYPGAQASKGKAGEPRCAKMDEKHELRCCSDKEVKGARWSKKFCQGHDLWVASDLRFPPGGATAKCVHAADLKTAVETCAQFGDRARLCTRAELERDCTKGPDCGHDEDLIWSSEPCACPRSYSFLSFLGVNTIAEAVYDPRRGAWDAFHAVEQRCRVAPNRGPCHAVREASLLRIDRACPVPPGLWDGSSCEAACKKHATCSAVELCASSACSAYNYGPV